MLSLVLLLLLAACATLPLNSTAADGQALLAFLDDLLVSPAHPLRWNSSGYGACSWTGVSCSPSTSRVISLSLPSMNLSGSLNPSHLADLPFLSFLNLSDNQFTGPIPSSLSRLQVLTHLDLHQNDFHGLIPSQLSLCQSLIVLDISRNPLSGPIPLSFATLRNLRMLQLHHIVNLSGPIPFQITELVNLTHLCFGHNNLTGTIPFEFGTMKNLVELAVYENGLTGNIPPQLGQLGNLQTLKLFSNNFGAGPLPPELGNMTSLQYLYLFNCNLSGSIPAELGELVNLLVLDLQQNHLSGPIPPTLGQLKSLTELNFYTNNVSGSIPPQLGQLGNLQNLFLGSNNLAGSIPPEIGNLRSLQILSIYFNNIWGPLPAELGQLTSLQYLHAWGNNLHGNLPSEIGLLKNLIQLNIGGNQLSGVIPEEFGGLESLQFLDMSDVRLSGTIPSTLGNLQNLTFLRLSKNKLSGTLPPALSNCSKLQYLKLENNSLTGKIPAAYATFPQLQTLSLHNNNLTGWLPSNFANPSSLIDMDLGYNHFSGMLPDGWSEIKNLRVLIVGHNQLEGSLPAWMWNFSQLQLLDLSHNMFTGDIVNDLSHLNGFKKAENISGGGGTLWRDDVSFVSKGTLMSYNVVTRITTSLDLSGNQFHGEIPEDIGKLSGLYNLNLSSNMFTGVIPNSLGDILGALESLDLSNNSLSGQIPSGLLRLTSLAEFNVSYNNLSGQIPQSPPGQFYTFTEESYLGNPSLCGYPVTSNCSQSGATNLTAPAAGGSETLTRKAKYAIAVVAAAAAFSLVCLGGALLLYRSFKRYRGLPWNAENFPIYLFDESLRVVERDIFHAIRHRCSDDNIIGVGGMSVVYKCVLSNGKVIAVKRTRTWSSHKEAAVKRSFLTEARILGQIKHRNVLKMLGICSAPDMFACILDFIPNGSLDDHLHDSIKACRLSWEDRYKVALGIAQGLSYLHNDTGFGQILHLDLKPSNILLHHDFEPRISDFGISRMMEQDQKWATLTSKFRGSIGYVAPECAYTQKVNDKADVYSFGMILLEMLTGKRPTSDAFGAQVDLRAWVASSFPQNTWNTVLDEVLRVGETPERYREVHELVQVGLLCTMHLPKSRPDMKDVLEMLVEIKKGKSPRVEFHTQLQRSSSPNNATFLDMGAAASSSSSSFFSST